MPKTTRQGPCILAGGGGRGKGPQQFWFRAAATAIVALRGVCPTDRASAAMLTRERNQVKYKSWHFYLVSREGRKNNEIIKKLRGACDSMTGRKPGAPNEPLHMEKLTKTKVQITWPMPCTIDACARVLKRAIGEDWKKYATRPAGAAWSPRGHPW